MGSGRPINLKMVVNNDDSFYAFKRLSLYMYLTEKFFNPTIILLMFPPSLPQHS